MTFRCKKLKVWSNIPERDDIMTNSCILNSTTSTWLAPAADSRFKSTKCELLHRFASSQLNIFSKKNIKHIKRYEIAPHIFLGLIGSSQWTRAKWPRAIFHFAQSERINPKRSTFVRFYFSIYLIVNKWTLTLLRCASIDIKCTLINEGYQIKLMYLFGNKHQRIWLIHIAQKGSYEVIGTENWKKNSIYSLVILLFWWARVRVVTNVIISTSTTLFCSSNKLKKY